MKSPLKIITLTPEDLNDLIQKVVIATLADLKDQQPGPAKPEKLYYNRQEAAEIFGVSPDRLKEVKPSKYWGPRTPLYTIEDIER